MSSARNSGIVRLTNPAVEGEGVRGRPPELHKNAMDRIRKFKEKKEKMLGPTGGVGDPPPLPAGGTKVWNTVKVEMPWLTQEHRELLELYSRARIQYNLGQKKLNRLLRQEDFKHTEVTAVKGVVADAARECRLHLRTLMYLEVVTPANPPDDPDGDIYD